MKIMLLRGNPTFVLYSFLPSAVTNDNWTDRRSATAATQCTIVKFCIRSSEQMHFLKYILTLFILCILTKFLIYKTNVHIDEHMLVL